MIKEYAIDGMSCDSCISKVSKVINTLEEIDAVEIKLSYPQAKITSKSVIHLDRLNEVLQKAGRYSISEQKVQKTLQPLPEIKRLVQLPEKSLRTYQPLLLIVSFIAGVSLLAQFPFASFSGMLWMRHFMAGFFIVFAFFKLLNIEGFAVSYRMYDIVAAKWAAWGYIYPFVELALGVLYLINVYPLVTNIATAIILGVSSIGVIQSNLSKKKIKCACLGDVFNLPMSTVTIVEDLTMVGMALLMIFIN